MDPFTQRILDRAEKRSKALGISSVSKFPLTEINQESQASSVPINKTLSDKRSPTKSSSVYSTAKDGSTTRIIKNVTERKEDCEELKENCDVNVEINITTGPNIQVQVEVEEQNVDAEGNPMVPTVEKAAIRGSSKNRLQRLGALYSNSENLSSPIHRTENDFHEDIDEHRRPISVTSRSCHRFGKLAALANEINNWEDDSSHPDYKQSMKASAGPQKPKRLSSPKRIIESPKKSTGAISKKYPVSTPPPTTNAAKKFITSPAQKDKTNAECTKQLNWDPKVMDALESQGFTRRESNTSKLVYEYNTNKTNMEEHIPIIPKPTIVPGSEIQKKKETMPQTSALTSQLISERTAVFEKTSKSSSSRVASKSNNKDPAEMSLKERMALFEKNKGKAPIPLAPLAISAGVKQIMGDQKSHNIVTSTQSTTKMLAPFNKPVITESKAPGTGIRTTVAALMANASTISEAQINEDVKRQRQEEMDVLLNRFNKARDGVKLTVPPIPPPMPPPSTAGGSTGSKRRSGDTKEINDSDKVRSVLDDVKRIRVNPPKDGQLYPALSDLETTESSDQDYTTASVNESTDSDGNQHLCSNAHQSFMQHQQTCDKDEFNDECVEEEEQDEDEEYDDENSYMDSEDLDSSGVDVFNGSLGRAVLQAVSERNQPLQSPYGQTKFLHREHQQHQVDSSATESEISDVLGDIDQYLNDEDEVNDEETVKTTSKKGSVSSNSFSYEKPVKHVRYDTVDEDEEVKLRQKPNFRTPVKSELTVNPSKDNNLVTLVHTVSFYRRTQQVSTVGSANNSPSKKIQRPITTQIEYKSRENEGDDSEPDNVTRETEIEVKEKIKRLLMEVQQQQTIISQTSQALNLCAATVEFSGSTEAVEGERHLLVATHRRKAALDEIQRLRVEGSVRPIGSPNECGRLSIKEITVPLKQDYIKKLATDAISGHHLVCLLKYNEHVLATRAMPTLPGLVSVKFSDVLQLNNVYADFKVTIEIFGMTAQKEILPHEVKYHIAMNKKGLKILTPKGKKPGENRLVMPPIQSPAGPGAVRTPALIHYGFVIFSLREIQRSSWSLNQSSGVSPLDGVVHMKVNCELSVSIDYRGFLTMFEDVSGFGAWHRRWCHLHGHVLNYWKYPDDEKKKTPIGSIDLYTCCSQKITLAPRDVCARLNTILLETKRPAQDDDVDSLVVVRHGENTIIRHLLSADTKDEREEWSSHLNKSLALLKAWGQSE